MVHSKRIFVVVVVVLPFLYFSQKPKAFYPLETLLRLFYGMDFLKSDNAVSSLM